MQEQRRHIEGTFMAAVCTASVQRVAEIGAPRLSFGSLRSVELSSRRAHNPPPPLFLPLLFREGGGGWQPNICTGAFDLHERPVD